MSDFVISCCSTADLPKEYFEKRNINYVCFHFELNGQQYIDDLGVTYPIEKFYNDIMDKNSQTRTSQVSIGEYEEYFKKFLDKGLDILHLCLSSGISGSYNSALNAKSLLKDKYPDRKIIIIDSLCASSGFGLLVDAVADLRDEGKNIDEIALWAEEHKLNVQHWFFSTDLTFYIRGGRVSKTAGTVGSLLGICPLLHVDKEGKLIPVTKIRSKKKAIKEIVEYMKNNISEGTDYSGKCFMSHSMCYDDAKEVADLVEKEFKNLNGPVKINYIGTTIGSHTGIGTIALFFFGNKR